MGKLEWGRGIKGLYGGQGDASLGASFLLTRRTQIPRTCCWASACRHRCVVSRVATMVLIVGVSGRYFEVVMLWTVQIWGFERGKTKKYMHATTGKNRKLVFPHQTSGLPQLWPKMYICIRSKCLLELRRDVVCECRVCTPVHPSSHRDKLKGLPMPCRRNTAVSAQSFQSECRGLRIVRFC